MRRIAIHLLIALLTFSIGLTLTHYLIFFEVEYYACGDRGGSVGYQSSDGVKVAKTGFGFDSSAEAAARLNALLSRADRIIEITPKLDKKGQHVGERIVGIFHPENSSERVAAVIWTEGKGLLCIESSSLRHVLKLERVLSEED
jgi:hypothetical protein